MANKNVKSLAALFGRTEEEVETALSAESGISEMIEGWQTNAKIFSKEDYEKLETNIEKKHLTKLLDKIKHSEAPSELYSAIKGIVSQKAEKALAKKYDFDGEYENLEDLQEKVIEKIKSENSKGSPDAGEKDKLIEDLKKNIKDIQAAADEKVNAAKSEAEAYITNSEREKALNSVALSYEDDKLEKQQKLFMDSFNANYDTKVVDGVLVTYRKGETDPITNDVLEPIPASQIALQHAAEYGFNIASPETGGQGGESSNGTKNPFAGMDEAGFREYCHNNDIEMNTQASDKIFIEWKQANAES